VGGCGCMFVSVSALCINIYIYICNCECAHMYLWMRNRNFRFLKELKIGKERLETEFSYITALLVTTMWGKSYKLFTGIIYECTR